MHINRFIFQITKQNLKKKKNAYDKTENNHFKIIPLLIFEGRKRRIGFGKKGKNSFTVHRSEEVLPGEMRGCLSRGSSASSDNEGSIDVDRFDQNGI